MVIISGEVRSGDEGGPGIKKVIISGDYRRLREVTGGYGADDRLRSAGSRNKKKVIISHEVRTGDISPVETRSKGHDYIDGSQSLADFR